MGDAEGNQVSAILTGLALLEKGAKVAEVELKQTFREMCSRLEPQNPLVTKELQLVSRRKAIIWLPVIQLV